MRRAVVVGADRAGLSAAGDLLRQGGNVAFPTETVYGLGGNALDEQAVLRIFEHKGRPLTDPLIVHVNDADTALGLVRARGVTLKIFKLLADAFWPGPLTMVLQAADHVPSAISAGTGFVGVRAPAHPVARDLLDASGVPVAAPSANRFGHVSPTSAAHVLADLGDKDIMVVDGGDLAQGCCTVGIESTVLKVVDSSLDCEDAESERSLVLFRKGGVPEAAIRKVLDDAGMSHVILVPPPAFSPKTVVKAQDEEDKAFEAPGQSITHYAPDVETWLLSGDVEQAMKAKDIALDQTPLTMQLGEDKSVNVATCVIIDYAGALQDLKPLALAYRDISPQGDISQAAQTIFDVLRWAEQIKGAEHVLLRDVSHATADLAPSVADRMYRAASGKVATNLRLLP
mmetsp:Transcript_19088/g.35336  ORF Transcript_19088/g.35336 Transcript_19088/m.35336 type:complete len:399 (-) Transcript_19088:223-1419(-)